VKRWLSFVFLLLLGQQYNPIQKPPNNDLQILVNAINSRLGGQTPVTPKLGKGTSTNVTGNYVRGECFVGGILMDCPVPGSGPGGPLDLSNYVGPVGITGNQTNGRDQINNVSVNGVFNVKAYGAKGDGSTNDNTAVQAALTACQTNGGTVFFPVGTYASLNLTLVMSGATKNCILQGAGDGVTTLAGVNSSTDILTIGTNGAEKADNISVRDMAFSGGRYSMRLNNTLYFDGENLVFGANGPVTDLYGEGTNEHVRLDNVQFNGSIGALGDVYIGATNGGTGSPALDLPETQKDIWTKIRCASAQGGPCMTITAGVLGAQQVSGNIHIDGIVFESNHKDDIDIHQAGLGVELSHMQTESGNMDADNTYQLVLIDTTSYVIIDGNSGLNATGTNRPKYDVNQQDGTFVMRDSVTGSNPARTYDLVLNALARLDHVQLVGGTATGVSQTGSFKQNQVFTDVTASDGQTGIFPIFDSGIVAAKSGTGPSGNGGLIVGNLEHVYNNEANPRWALDQNMSGGTGIGFGPGGATAIATKVQEDASANLLLTARSGFIKTGGGFNLSSGGVINSSGGSAPTLSSCGTSPSAVSGTNVTGQFTTGTGAPTGCTITFATAPQSGMTAAPRCQWQDNTASPVTVSDAPTVAPTATDVLTLSAAATSHVLKYHCDWQG
jgi:hypothetical protein